MAPLTKIILLASCLLLSKWCHTYSLLGVDGLHASCSVDWTFGIPCASVKEALIDQIDKWKGDDCGTGEKCLYQFVSSEGNTLEAKHETPKHHYIDDLTFTFREENGVCKVLGYRTIMCGSVPLDFEPDSDDYVEFTFIVNGRDVDKSTDEDPDVAGPSHCDPSPLQGGTGGRVQNTSSTTIPIWN